MLTESTIIDRLEVLETGTVQVRQATIVKRGDDVVAESFHRWLIDIADENPDLSKLDDASKAVVLAARTPERLAAAAERKAADAASFTAQQEESSDD